MRIINILISLIFIFIFILNVERINAQENNPFHHTMPQQFRDQFKKAGINIDDYTIQLEKDIHQKLHGSEVEWNKQWNDYLSNNPNPSKSEILSLNNKMVRDVSEMTKQKVIQYYNYNNKQPTGELFSRFSNETLSGNPAAATSYVDKLIQSAIGIGAAAGTAISLNKYNDDKEEQRRLEEQQKQNTNILYAIAALLIVVGAYCAYLKFGIIIAVILFLIQASLLFISWQSKNVIPGIIAVIPSIIFIIWWWWV